MTSLHNGLYALLVAVLFTESVAAEPLSGPDLEAWRTTRARNDYERLFGLDPTSGTSVNPISVPLNPTAGTFSYTRRDETLTGMSHTIWYSLDLERWFEDTGATQAPAAAVAGIETVAVTLASAAPSDGKLFIRVEATP